MRGETGRQVTERQLETLEFIAHTIIVNGWGPSLRDMCNGLQIASPNTATARLEALERHGFVERGGIHRTVRVTRLGYRALAGQWKVPFDPARP